MANRGCRLIIHQYVGPVIAPFFSDANHVGSDVYRKEYLKLQCDISDWDPHTDTFSLGGVMHVFANIFDADRWIPGWVDDLRGQIDMVKIYSSCFSILLTYMDRASRTTKIRALPLKILHATGNPV